MVERWESLICLDITCTASQPPPPPFTPYTLENTGCTIGGVLCSGVRKTRVCLLSSDAWSPQHGWSTRSLQLSSSSVSHLLSLGGPVCRDNDGTTQSLLDKITSEFLTTVQLSI